MTSSTNRNHLVVSSQSASETLSYRDKSFLPTLPLQGMSRAKNILPFLPFGRTTLHEWSRDGRFPASVRLSPTMVAWKNSEVLEWLENHSNPVNSAQENINE
tara:strand:- start:2256 stop:2561 length:306 start_codon:yes stop_codon:yes gene_type:complete